MAQRILWDKYEAAILLDACLRVEEGSLKRETAITNVSTLLRERAQSRGLEIDSIFRNENGIAMRLVSMSQCLHHESGGLTTSALFHEIVQLYETDKKAFEMLVAEAKDFKEKSDFENWLKDNPKYSQTYQVILKSLNILSSYYLKEGIIQKPIKRMNSESEVLKVIELLEKNKKPHIHSRSQLRSFKQATSVYLEFLHKTPELDETGYSCQIIQILEKHFPYGFRINSPIENIKFRNFAEVESLTLPASDKDLENEIISVGSVLNGKVFYFKKSTVSELADLLDQAFKSGTNVIFIDCFREIHQEWFENNFITSLDIFKKLLTDQFPQYTCGLNTIFLENKKTEVEAIVTEIHRIAGQEKVVITNDLCKKLPYIPASKISWTLSASDNFIAVDQGKYFLMKYFQLNDSEVFKITSFVKTEYSQKGYVSIAEIPYEDILEQNYELSDSALQMAIYNTILKSNYKLNGKILTKKSDELNLVTILKDYCLEHSTCTLEEVLNYSEELVGEPNRQNSLKALYSSLVRIDKDSFIEDSQVQFDIETIDSILVSIIGKNFIPLKAITTFTLFPTCGLAWNLYLLESFCFRFSKKYKLQVLNFNDKNVGIIVPKESNLSYEELLTLAAKDSGIDLTPEDLGEYFFQNGYTTKRKMKSLPKIVDQAKLLRERN